MNNKTHWQNVYQTKQPEEVSWYQGKPQVSLKLIQQYAPEPESAIIDVGAGASMLVDFLIAKDYSDITLLDISEAALLTTIERHIGCTNKVQTIVGDITQVNLPQQYQLWHDRAVFHFLTEPEQQQAYKQQVSNHLVQNGIFILATFAPGGPEKCSGLPICQHDLESITALFGDSFELLHSESELHHTPWNAEQTFNYFVLQKR